MNLTYMQNELKKIFGGENYEIVLGNSPKKNKVEVTIRWQGEDQIEHVRIHLSNPQLSRFHNQQNPEEFIRQLIIEKRSKDTARAEALR